MVRLIKNWDDLIPFNQVLQTLGLMAIFYVFIAINGVELLRSVQLETDYFSQFRNAVVTLFMFTSRDSVDDIIQSSSFNIETLYLTSLFIAGIIWVSILISTILLHSSAVDSRHKKERQLELF